MSKDQTKRNLLRSIFLVVTTSLLSSCVPEGKNIGRLHLPKSQSIDKKVLGLEYNRGFPAEKDLAILIPLDTDYPIAASISNGRGDGLLRRTWLSKVSQAYGPTVVEDALDVENEYEDWRLVAARVTPCMPLGISLRQSPDDYCWPAVRLVWQPVIPNFFINGLGRRTFADDRAIHAIYHVLPSASQANVLNTVRQHLAQGGRPASLSASVRRQFEGARNSTVQVLFEALYNLRLYPTEHALYREIETRPAYDNGDEAERIFRTRFVSFLNRFAEPSALTELTSFSLPEGRVPSGLDLWVFIAFDAYNGVISQKDLQIFDAESGRELVNMGPVETVTQTTEDERIIAALRQSPELRQSVVFSPSDLDQLSGRLADPERLLVPNTSCASCHRLNGIRFNFHNLSHLEDRPATVSSRVVQDVAKDIRWIRTFRPPTSSSENTSSSNSNRPTSTTVSGSSPDRLEDNNSFSQASRLAVSSQTDNLNISRDDKDYFVMQHGGGDLEIDIRFSHSEGDLDIILYDSQRRNIATSDSSTNNENINKNLTAGSYYLQVYGYRNASASYSLQLSGQGPTMPSTSAPPAQSYEPNETLAQAAPIQLPFDNAELNIDNQDNDYYVFEINAGRVEITLDLDHSRGDLDLELYRTNGTKISNSASTSNLEKIESSLDAGRYIVRVFGYARARGDYRLRVETNVQSSTPVPSNSPAQRSQTFEPNDTIRTASRVTLPFIAQALDIDAGDEDFFTFTTSRGSREFSIQFAHADGDLDLYLYDANGNIVRQSDSITNNETIREFLQAGSYWLRIVGYRNAAARYTISIR